jgi:hypothetical protein
MHHQLSFRKGWQSENLALYILHQFAFVARPHVVADDIGIDFYCTLFETKDKKHLVPRTPFAIQIKSDRRPIANNRGKVDYFNNLDLPFFIAVVNKSKNSMEVYSGEHLPHFAPWKGNPLDPNNQRNYINKKSRVLFKPTNKQVWDPKVGIEKDNEHHTILFPSIGTASIQDPASVQKLADAIQRKSSMIQRNIAAWKSGSYVLETSTEHERRFYAGPTSADTFRDNLNFRLAEAYMNMKWILEQRDMAFDTDELQRYEKIYELLSGTPGYAAQFSLSFNAATDLRTKLLSQMKQLGLNPLG